MKKIINLLIYITIFSMVGCSNVDDSKTVSSFKEEKNQIYSSEDSKAVKKLLKSYGKSDDLTVEKVSKKDILVIEDEEIVANKDLWDNFYENSNNKKEDDILVLKYTAQNDPILIYLSYKDNKFYMMEDDSRDQYRDTKDEDYYEYTFKYMKLFEENEKTYVYLLDDNNVTLEELNYSLLSSQISDWIPYGFVFYYKQYSI